MLENKWYSIQEAAAEIGCTTGYVRQLLASDVLAGEKVGQRAWLVTKESVKKFQRIPKKTGRPRLSEKK